MGKRGRRCSQEVHLLRGWMSIPGKLRNATSNLNSPGRSLRASNCGRPANRGPGAGAADQGSGHGPVAFRVAPCDPISIAESNGLGGQPQKTEETVWSDH